VLAIGLMTLVHPFELPRVLLAVLALAALAAAAPHGHARPPGGARRWRRSSCCRAWRNLATTSTRPSPRRCACPTARWWSASSRRRGVFEVLDNFTERLDIDLSNNDTIAGAEPVATYGLYGDGNRLTSLARQRRASCAT
jgi:hypothetical protein